jgi:TPR repeat protein
MLSGFYSSGIGVQVDQARSIELLESAAKAGSPEGMLLLGVSYEHGMGVKEDHSRALALWRSAAQLGNVDAQCSLGSELIKSTKPEEMSEGVRWLRAAAERGHYAAHYALADLYETGTAGVSKNAKLAANHRAKAADLLGD